MLALSAGSARSIRVAPEAGNHYVKVTPGQTYRFELAVRALGEWRTLCSTGRVEMPPAGPAAVQPQSPGRRPPSPPRDRDAPYAFPGVPGLSLESTPLRLGSSPHGRPERPD